MILKLLNWIIWRRPIRFITGENNDLYLIRSKIWGWMPGDTKEYKCSGYLHRFFRHDLDRALHSHPWRWSISIILWGGYIEERLQPDGTAKTRRLWPQQINFFGKGDFHRISELKGLQTWSLFIAGPRCQGWGFLVPDRGFVPHAQYLKERGL